MSRQIFKKSSNFFALFWLNVVVKKRQFVEFCRVCTRYYHRTSFWKADVLFFFHYLFRGPFAISKRFLVEAEEKDVYTYGETPLTSLAKIAEECALSARDVVFELGCGRGKTAFWLREFVGCKVVGIEMIPAFVEKAESIRETLQIEGVEFRLGDMFEEDFTGATHLYLYGTCLEDGKIRRLIERLETMPEGTKIITVSYSLTDYTTSSRFHLEKQFPVTFTWGEGMVYLQRLV